MQGRVKDLGSYIGIDISKRSFDAHCMESGEDRHFDYTDEGVRECIDWLEKIEPILVLMEATGGYEMALATELLSKAIPVKVINPRRVRDFAKALGRLAKTDKIDAMIIAQYAATFDPLPQERISELSIKLKALASRRRQLMDMRIQELNRKEHAFDGDIVKSIALVIATIDREIAKVDKQINKHIDQTPTLKKKSRLLQSMPGIGNKTACMIICHLPELGLLDRRQIASLVGLAPMNRDSGQFKGKRMIGGGRGHVRKALYMPALVAIRHNPVLHNYYHRLLDAGKTKMVALVAVMRKMLTILNAMVAKQQPWKPNMA